MPPLLRKIFPSATTVGRAKTAPTTTRAPAKTGPRCAGCAARQGYASPYRYCQTCGEYQPSGKTLGLDPVAAFWGLATALAFAIGCAEYYASETFATLSDEIGNLPLYMEPWVIAFGYFGIVYYAIITGRRIGRGEWASALDFAITYAIASAANALIHDTPAIGWSYDYFAVIHLNGILMPIAYGTFRLIRRLLKRSLPNDDPPTAG